MGISDSLSNLFNLLGLSEPEQNRLADLDPGSIYLLISHGNMDIIASHQLAKQFPNWQKAIFEEKTISGPIWQHWYDEEFGKDTFVPTDDKETDWKEAYFKEGEKYLQGFINDKCLGNRDFSNIVDRACRHNNLIVMRYCLLTKNINLNATLYHNERVGKKPLWWAALGVQTGGLRPDNQFLSDLLAYGCNVNSVNEYSFFQPSRGTVALHEVARNGDSEKLKILLQYGVNPDVVNKQDQNGNTPLNIAIRAFAYNRGFDNKHLTETIALLYQNGAQDIPNDMGWTPLFIAINSPLEFLETFLKARAGKIDLHHLDKKGDSVLTWYCRFRAINLIGRSAMYVKPPSESQIVPNQPLTSQLARNVTDKIPKIQANLNEKALILVENGFDIQMFAEDGFRTMPDFGGELEWLYEGVYQEMRNNILQHLELTQYKPPSP